LSSLWTVVLLLARGRSLFRTLASKRRKIFCQTSFSWITSGHFDFNACFRSSTEETSASLSDCDRFQIRPHDSTLEHTVDSQEKAAGDATPGDPPKSSPPPKKKMIKPKLVLVSSSGEPSGPKRHVSPKILAFTTLIFAHQ
jgi:hypothetical protein